jgi:hypothetical protein
VRDRLEHPDDRLVGVVVVSQAVEEEFPRIPRDDNVVAFCPACAAREFDGDFPLRLDAPRPGGRRSRTRWGAG